MIELDRPWRARRRDRAKSDSIDAVRAARDALGREHHAQPRTGEGRAALATLLAARRSAVKAAADAQHQLDGLIVTAPEILREKFRGRSSLGVLARARHLRIDPRWDLETRTMAGVLRGLARRVQDLHTEANEHRAALVQLVRSLRPELLDLYGVGPIVAAVVLCAWSHPGRSAQRPHSPSSAGWHPSPPRRA